MKPLRISDGSLEALKWIALGGLASRWWPLNVLFTLFVVASTLLLIEKGRAGTPPSEGRRTSAFIATLLLPH